MAITDIVYVGTDGTTTIQFADASGTAVDPSTVTVSFQLYPGGSWTVWTYLGTGSITKLGTGNYSAVIPTAAASVSSQPNLVCVWRGTGALNAVGMGSVKMQNPPA